MPSKYIAPAFIIALSLDASRGEMLYSQPIEVMINTPEADGVWASDGYGYVLSIFSEDKAPQLLHAATPLFFVPPQEP